MSRRRAPCPEPAPFSLVTRRQGREEDLSTEQARAQAPPRFPRADGDQGRPEGDRGAARPRPQAPVRLDRTSPMRGARARTFGRLTKRPEFLAAAAGRRFHTERMTVQ